MSDNIISYQTIHSPRGANANFTMGMVEQGGGFSLQQGRLPSQDIYLGYKEGHSFHCLPYYTAEQRFEKSSFGKKEISSGDVYIEAFDKSDISRKNEYATDTFSAGRLTFELCTPVSGILNADSNAECDVKLNIIPALLAKLTIDNIDGTEIVDGCFGISPMLGKEFIDDDSFLGINSNDGYGFATKKQEGVFVTSGYESFALFLRPYEKWILPNIGALIFRVLPGEKKTFDISLSWYRGNVVTHGAKSMKFYYTNYYKNINDVHKYLLTNISKVYSEAKRQNDFLAAQNFNDDRKFIISQSVKSYFGSSMLYDDNKKMCYKINEGTFMMINTFDLFIDHIFFELEMQPWSVKNQLESALNEYSYYDSVHYPNSSTSYKGGISFCHDQGAYFTFTPFGTSSYELKDMEGVFAYMSQEQLCNFILGAGMYAQKTRDFAWINKRSNLLEDLYESMLNRDAEEECKRDGIQDLESDKVGSGKEATTYDNLDPSLVSSARGLYIAIKCFSSYIALWYLFEKNGKAEKATLAYNSACLCARTIVSFYDENKGYIPSKLIKNSDSPAIIPAIEGLIYPVFTIGENKLYQTKEFKELYDIMKLHFEHVFKKGCCRFDDGRWKLSQTSDIGFSSKIFLCQFVAEEIFNIKFDDIDVQDKKHADDWRINNPTNPCWDQTWNLSERNFHYPRAVTSALWLYGKNNIKSAN